MSTSIQTQAANPASWNPWPVALATFLGLFFAAVVGFGIFAIGHSQDLVRPDYYEQEIRYQEQIDRVARTRALPGQVEIALDPSTSTLNVRIPEPALGTLQLYRPSDASLDRNLSLEPDAHGRQSVDLKGLKSGLWKVRMTWRKGSDEFYHDTSIVMP